MGGGGGALVSTTLVLARKDTWEGSASFNPVVRNITRLSNYHAFEQDVADNEWDR